MKKLLLGLLALGSISAHAELVKVNQFLYALDPVTLVLKHVTTTESGTYWVTAKEAQIVSSNLVKINGYLYALDKDTFVLKHVTTTESGTYWVTAQEVSK